MLLLVLVALCAWVGVRGYLAKNHLEKAAALVPQLEQQARSGHPDEGQLRRLQDETHDARRLTGDVVWSWATHAPVVGDDLAAVRAAAVAVDVVARDAVPPLMSVADTLDPAELRPRNGRIDLAPLTKARVPLHEADGALRRATATLAPFVDDGKHADSLVAPVEGAVVQLHQRLARLADETATGSRAADVLPPMLGAEGKRRYLVLFQNLAEARSLGGIAGAYAVVEADKGALRVTAQGSGSSIPVFDQPVLDLGPAAQELYQKKPTRFFVDVTQAISFPDSARVAQRMWQERRGVTVDGVVATDPVALSYLLKASGPVRLPGGITMSSDDAVKLLLSDVYSILPNPQAQDAFFAAATMAVFQQLLSGEGDPAAMIQALARAGGEHRLLVWTDHEAQQKRLAGTVLEGRLPRTEPRRPTIGVFLNEGTASKISYYLRTATDVTGGRCRDDGYRELQLDLTLSSEAPRSGLSTYVAGHKNPYTMEPVVYLASPLQGGLSTVTVDGKPRAVNSQQVDGRMVAALRVEIPAGKQVRVTATYLVPDTTAHAALRITPGTAPNARSIRIAACPPV